MSNYRLHIATATHKGDREYQQDRVEVLQHPYNKKCLLVVVADGMGGLSGGALASGQVVQTARDLLRLFDIEKDDPAVMLMQLVNDAHAVIRMLRVSSEHEPHSTLAVWLLLPTGECHWVHSGDSRIYRFRSGHLVARTKDHSYVQALIDSGEIDEAAAANHPKSNLLTGCLGTEKTPHATLARMGKLQPGDALLGCTDGLWGYFTDKELAKTVEALTPADACQQLLATARERAAGGGDNVSLVILKATPQTHADQHQPAEERRLDLDWQ